MPYRLGWHFIRFTTCGMYRAQGTKVCMHGSRENSTSHNSTSNTCYFVGASWQIIMTAGGNGCHHKVTSISDVHVSKLIWFLYTWYASRNLLMVLQYYSMQKMVFNSDQNIFFYTNLSTLIVYVYVKSVTSCMFFTILLPKLYE